MEAGSPSRQRALRPWLALPTVALVLCVTATLVPWLTVAGRSRNGLRSAELLISVAEAGAPEGLRVAGILWYAGAFAALLSWATAVLAVRRWQHRSATAGAVLALLCWACFVAWAGSDDRVLMRWPGPLIGLVGATALVVAAAVRARRHAAS